MPEQSLTLPPAEPDYGDLDPLARPGPTRMSILLEWLAAQPLVPAAIGLVAGILLDAARAVPGVLALVAFLAAGGLLLLVPAKPCLAANARLPALSSKRQDSQLRIPEPSLPGDGIGHLALMLAAMAVGAVLHDLSFRRWPADHLVRYCAAQPAPVRITGTVIDDPVIRPVVTGRITWFKQSPRTRMLLAAERIEGVAGDIPVSGTVAVHVREPVLHVSAGDRVELFGTMYRPRPPANPGEKDWALVGRRNGVLVEISCKHAANVLVRAIGAHGHRWMAGLRRRLRAAMLDQTFPRELPGAQLLSALVLGQRTAVNSELNEAFVATGTVHYLSVSGAHVGMLMSAVWLIGLLVGGSRRACAVWAMVLVTTYAILAEPREAILRAAVMADAFGLAILLRRPVRSMNWLALAAIVLLLVKPTRLFNPGFQLSFLSVAAIMLVSPRLHRAVTGAVRRLRAKDDPLLSPEVRNRLNPPSPKRRLINGAVKVLGWYAAISVSAWLVGVLLGMYHFGQMALWGWLNSMLVMPLIWLTLLMGLTKTILTMACAPLAGLAGWLLAAVTNVLVEFVRFLARLPGAGIPAPAVSGFLTVAAMAVLGLWVLAPWLRITGRWVAVSALVLVLLAAWQLAPAGPSDTLRVHVLSVGDGTACVLALPNGKTVIYDLGSRPPYDLERWTVGPLLARRRAYRVAAVILSHANLDHFSGLPDLLDHRPVAGLIAPPHFERFSPPSSAGRRLIADVQQHGIAWQTAVRGDRLTGTGEVTIEVLWPPPPGDLAIRRVNDTSIVLAVSYAGRRLLLCGDIQDYAQRQLLASADLKADVLILPHHGGVVASTRAFIEAVDPEFCIRSSGRRNAQTRTGLLHLVAGRNYYNTADDGAVEIRVTPGQLTVRPWLHPGREKDSQRIHEQAVVNSLD